MTAAICKWGNGAGLRIPQPFLRQLGLVIGDEVKIEITNSELIVTKAGPTLEELLSKCTPENRHADMLSDSRGEELL